MQKFVIFLPSSQHFFAPMMDPIKDFFISKLFAAFPHLFLITILIPSLSIYVPILMCLIYVFEHAHLQNKERFYVHVLMILYSALSVFYF